MIEEYNSTVKNGVWEIVLRLEGKLVVDSRRMYRVKHVTNGNIEKYKAWFIARGSPRKWELTLRRPFFELLGILPSRPLCL